MSNKRILSRSVATLFALAPFVLHAGTQTITAFGDPTDGTEGVNPSWGVAANWGGDNGAALPGVGDLAQILYGGDFNAAVDIRGSDFIGTPANFTEVAGVSFIGATTAEVDLENNSTTANMTLALNGSGGTVPLIQTGDFFVQILNVGLGAVVPTTNTLTLQLKGSGDINVGNGGLTISAPITQSGGTFGFNKTGPGTLTLNGTTANTYTGTTTISEGTLVASKPTGINAIPGNLDLEAGGTFLYLNNNVGNQIANTAKITINGGNFGDLAQPTPTNPGAPETVASVTVNSGNFSTGRALFVTTGLFNATGGITLVQRGGMLTTGSTSISGGIVDLDGGSTTAGDESRLTVGAGGLTLNGGTINFDSDSGNLTTGSLGSIVALAGNVTATGANYFVHMNSGVVGPKANVDLGNAVRTFNVPGIADSLNLGAVGATVTVSNGGLIKTGAGTLSLSGASTGLTGAMTVSNGSLVVNGSIGSGTAIAVQGPASLVLNGALARGVTLTGGAVLTGAGTMTTLTLGANANDTAVLNILPSTGLTVSTANSLIANAGAGKVTINILGAIPSFGQYPLIDYSGSIAGTTGFSSFAIGSTPGGQRVGYVLQNNTTNTSIQLNVVADFPVWKGALSSEWSTNTLANPKNWVLNSNNAVTTDFLSTDSVTFNDVATATTVDISIADVTPTAVTFANATKNYTITGSQAIAGSTGLTKNGAGAVAINNTNSFTGAVTLNAGTVTVASIADAGLNSPLGAGTALAINGGTLEFTGANGSTNRTITLAGTAGAIKTTSASTSLTLTGTISGSGGLTKSGNGTLTLGGTSANTSTGLTTVSAGTLVANKPAGTNAIAGNLLIQGTGAFRYAGNNVSDQIANTATITVFGGTFGDPSSANPTDPGATDTVANVTVSGGTFNSGRNAAPFTITNALSVSSGTALVQSGGGISAKTVQFSGGALNLDGGSTTAGQESKLIVGSGGLTLTGSTIDLNAGPSTVGAASVGSIVDLDGDVTSTGTSGFARLNPTVSNATIDLGGAVRTFNVTGALNIGSVGAPITVTDGSINKTGTGVLTLSGPQNYTALTTSAGTTTLNSPLGTGTSSLTANAATILNTQQKLASLSIGSGGMVTLAAYSGGPGNVKVIDTSALTFAGNGKLDLTNNAMIVRGATLAAVNAQIKSGYNIATGYWDGPGINSSTAANDPTGLGAIGVVDNAEFGLTSFAGVSGLTGAEILVKYTYLGDADLSGSVDLSDFTQFFAGFTGEVPAEWFYGDFDYSGAVDLSDFTLFFAGLTEQGGALRNADSAIMAQEVGQMAAQFGVGGVGAGDGSSTPTASQAVVPEPGSIGLLAVGALGLLARRRR